MTELGDAIRKARQDKELTLMEAAGMIGNISAMALSKIETGKSIPTSYNLERIARFYSLDYTELLRMGRYSSLDEESQQARIARSVYNTKDPEILNKIEELLRDKGGADGRRF